MLSSFRFLIFIIFNASISLSFWRIYFAGYRILGWHLFSYRTLKIFSCFLAFIVSEEKSVFNLCFLYVMCLFLLVAFTDFLFVIRLHQFDMMCLGVVFFVFIQFGVCQDSWIFEFMASIKLKNVRLFFPICFCHIHSFLSFWNSNYMFIRLLILSHRSLSF